MTSGGDNRRLRSYGDYLCLGDAASLVGTRIVDRWKDSDLDATDGAEITDATRDRVERVRKHLIRLLSGGVLQAFGQDHEGAFHEIERRRLSNPDFDIDIHRSLFQWARDDWASIYVSKSELNRHLDEISNRQPRKSIKYDWQKVTSMAWKLALEDQQLRETTRLIGAVQDAFIVSYDGKPDDKELRGLVNEIIDFLGDRTLSREVSSVETSSDSLRDSV